MEDGGSRVFRFFTVWMPKRLVSTDHNCRFSFLLVGGGVGRGNWNWNLWFVMMVAGVRVSVGVGVD